VPKGDRNCLDHPWFLTTSEENGTPMSSRLWADRLAFVVKWEPNVQGLVVPPSRRAASIQCAAENGLWLCTSKWLSKNCIVALSQRAIPDHLEWLK
jgi:hypothetical protein